MLTGMYRSSPYVHTLVIFYLVGTIDQRSNNSKQEQQPTQAWFLKTGFDWIDWYLLNCGPIFPFLSTFAMPMPSMPHAL
ncbi:hypothetical protein AUEXF2481DRAFT_507131 [Aureobasidium subglaciale EXF-2481]|uniref:Uncharacterized protein n=1 Tax=Aureobasidium subglaciale (strain EXF-2481) TaxID=1043005 RepID=A0A074Y5P2_AURSE|nr:uncharacterized protein AUEXF2481DRAFT_507131 [Aureobasidium subglaciale EXF-2481]KEQ91274.1 hypothetical protein AUEXF2481DRAFT_507131 [Aureobasidium subglaciale EXF-2481]